jgi:hypothetical protein
MEPDMPSVPDQVPLAVQVLALELDQERVALWPGITALGLMVTLAVARGAVCVVVTAGVPLLQPERTKAEKRSMTKTKETAFKDPVGTCIRPSFYRPSSSPCWINRIQYRVTAKEHINM